MEKTFSGFIGEPIKATKIDGYNLYYWEDGSNKYIGTVSGLTFKGVEVLDVIQHTYGCLTEETKEEFIKQNKEKIEEKYGVEINHISEGISTVSVVVYEKGYLESLNESKRLEKERKTREMNERLNKLNEIF